MVSGHTEDTLSHDEDAATGLLGERPGPVELLDEALHVVMVEHEALALVKPDTIDHAGVALAVVDDHIMATDQRLDGTLATLVAVVE